MIPKGNFKVTVALKTSHITYTYNKNRIIKSKQRLFRTGWKKREKIPCSEQLQMLKLDITTAVMFQNNQ